MKTEFEVFENIKRLDLHRTPDFDKLTKEKFAEIYNGCGPDSWPQWARTVMTWVFRNFPEILGVHDVGYYFSDGTRAGWQITQDNWRYNISVVLASVYPCRKFWMLPLRAVAWCKLKAAYKVLRAKSFEFYVDSAISGFANLAGASAGAIADSLNEKDAATDAEDPDCPDGDCAPET